MDWTVGNQVRHPAKPEWGLGKILAVLNDDKLRVRFKNAGEKLLKGAPLVLVTQGTPVGARGRRSIEEYKKAFLDLFPKGFRDDRYLDRERAYKVAASKMLRATLAKRRMQALIGRGDHDETCRLALAVVKATNLIFPNEKMDLTDALRTKDARQRFSNALFSLLHGGGSFDDRFTAFCDLLANLDAAQWTIATYFPYLAEPDTHMFLKAIATKRIAAACDVALNYKSAPNIVTYRSLLRLSDRLEEELADLGPTDKIDLQSFIWCVAR